MHTRLPTPLQAGLLSLPLLAAAAVLAALTLGEASQYVVSVSAVLAIIAGLVLIAGVTGAFERQASPERANAALRKAAAPLNIPLTGAVTPPERAMFAAATAARGDCPLGFRPEDCWRISPAGTLSPVACDTAAKTIDAVLKSSGSGQAACRCPLGAYSLTFAVSAA